MSAGARSWGKTAHRGFVLALAGFALVGCGGASFRNGEYRSDGLNFRVGPIPSSLQRLDSSEALVALRDDTRDATWAINGRCNKDSDDVPLRALVEHLFFRFDDRKYVKEVEYLLDDRQAREVELTAKMDGVARQFVVVVVRKNFCVYDFMHISRVGEEPTLVQSRDEFRAMVRGFHVVRER